MSIMTIPLLDTNYGEISRYVTNGALNENFMIKCNQVHLDGVGYFCSEQCHTRQKIRKLYKELALIKDNLAIYTAELKEVQWRWDSLDKNIIDEKMAEYEKTFKEQLIGRSTTDEVHLALEVLEEKISAFFEVIYCLISSMADHQNLYSVVRMHLPEEVNKFFAVFENTKRLMQELLVRTVCVTEIDLVMILMLCFNLKFRLLIPSIVAVKASVCPFVIKSLDTSKIVVPGADKLRVYDYGPITPDFENFYLKSATERYDLQMPGVAEGAEANEKERGGKRPKKMTVDSKRICPLKRNVKYFVLTKPNNTLEADFSKIRLQAINKDEQLLRKRMAMGRESPSISVRHPFKDVGVMEKGFEKLKRKISRKRSQTQAATSVSVEPKNELEEKRSPAELLNYILVAVEIQFPDVSFNFYKKIKVPVAVVSNAYSQRPDAYGSTIWNLIVWLEEANKTNYQWDWPEPYKGSVQMEVSDADYRIDHEHFVKTYLDGMITILVGVKPGETQNKLGEILLGEIKFVHRPITVETHVSDEEYLKIFSDPVCTDPEYPTEPIHYVKPTPKNLHADQSDFLSSKLLNLSTFNGFVTRASFLKRVVKDTEMSFFCWFFYTCQAIGQNFGIKQPKKSNWFGDPTKSVWHSNFVVGYIDESKAEATLQKFRGEENQILLIRFSGSERQSVVIHMISGPYGPVQRSPVAVGLTESLASILQNPLFTPNYKIVAWDSQDQFVLKPILEFYKWVAQATNNGPGSRTIMASNNKSACSSLSQPKSGFPRSGTAFRFSDQMMVDQLFLPTLLGELKLKQNAAKDLCEFLTEVKQSSEESDYFDGPAMKKKLREILSDSPELLRLLKSCAK